VASQPQVNKLDVSLSSCNQNTFPSSNYIDLAEKMKMLSF